MCVKSKMAKDQKIVKWPVKDCNVLFKELDELKINSMLQLFFTFLFFVNMTHW